MTWTYEKLDEDLKRKSLPTNDTDGKITGRIVFGLKAWMDENPEERKRLGWIKHVHWEKKELDERWPCNHRNQYRLLSPKYVDEYTIEDDYHIIDKTEELMLLEEMLQTVDGGRIWDNDDSTGGIVFYG